jgi:hypothetical protein
MHKPDAEGSAKTLNPKTTFREHENVTPHRAGIATLPGRESGPQSAPNPTRIGSLLTAQLGTNRQGGLLQHGRRPIPSIQRS